MLMGIVAKNAIMLVDFAVEAVHHGIERDAAILDAAQKRARPIIMTTIAMAAGMFPSALGLGDGGGFRSPMAIAVIGGLIMSTMLSLVFVPAVFTVLDDLGSFTWRLLSRFVGASKYANQGQRVVAGQRLMQASSDIFLGWQRVEAGLDGQQRDFYVRQLRDWKFSVDIETMVPRGMRLYGEVCGWTLARAHARSGDRIAIAAYLGGSDVFDRAITEFAAAYADQNERDHKSLLAAVASGRIAAEPDL